MSPTLSYGDIISKGANMAVTREQYNRIIEETQAEMEARKPCEHLEHMLVMGDELYCSGCGEHFGLQDVEPRD